MRYMNEYISFPYLFDIVASIFEDKRGLFQHFILLYFILTSTEKVRHIFNIFSEEVKLKP